MGISDVALVSISYLKEEKVSLSLHRLHSL